MVIKTINFERLIKKFDRMAKVDYEPIIKTATILVQTTAKKDRSSGGLVPVDSGDLQRSIHRKVFREKGTNNVAGIVFTTLEYAPHIEFGTVKMAAQPFMRPALEMNRSYIKQAMASWLKSELKKHSHG